MLDSFLGLLDTSSTELGEAVMETVTGQSSASADHTSHGASTDPWSWPSDLGRGQLDCARLGDVIWVSLASTGDPGANREQGWNIVRDTSNLHRKGRISDGGEG